MTTKNIKTILFFLFILLSTYEKGICSNSEELLSNLFAEGITVDLLNPTYTEGVLSTNSGGVIRGPDLRIQALCITYTRKLSNDVPLFTVVAEGNLCLEYGPYIFIGDKLEYDFQTRTGTVYNGKSGLEPWYFGGEKIELCSDGSYRIHHGFITTSENSQSDWQIRAEEAHIIQDKFLNARNVQFRVVNLPLIWVPSFRLNLESIFDNPLRYRVRWGGNQGLRIGAIYEMLSWEFFKVFLRLDYRFNRGLGGGVETEYRSVDNHERFLTSNYVARDSSIDDPDEQIRYRFEGIYVNHPLNDTFSVDLSYDKLSDRDMETDYYERDLELKTAQRTQLLIRKQEDDFWITNFLTRVRLNNFQTVKQELPSLGTSLHPIEIGNTGIITDNQFNISYLDFKYSNGLPNVSDYNSTRLAIHNRIYRPMKLGPINHTPQIGFVGINYGNSPEHTLQTIALGAFGYEINTSLTRTYTCWKHAIEPYISYNYYTFPTSGPREHYIFDIEDGWYRLNMLRFGCRNLIYIKKDTGFISRYLMADLYANAFFKTPTMPLEIPYVYGRVVWDSFPFLRHTLSPAWDIQRNQISYINFRTEWTVNEDAAIAAEYRHRNDFAWRKVDHANFILESFHSEAALRASALSDRRDTLLLHFFYRLKPNWALEFESRHGWNRRLEPSYTEYEVDLLTTIQTAWHVKISYQHKQDDDRIAFYVNVGVRPPEQKLFYCE